MLQHPFALALKLKILAVASKARQLASSNKKPPTPGHFVSRAQQCVFASTAAMRIQYYNLQAIRTGSKANVAEVPLRSSCKTSRLEKIMLDATCSLI